MAKATENSAVIHLRSIRSATQSVFNSFGAASAASVGGFEGANAATELVGHVAKNLANLFTELENGAIAVGSEMLKEFEMIMRILDPIALLESFGKLIVGISEAVVKLLINLLHEIKKIIRVLWELIFGDLPKWLETILLLIDELAKDAAVLLFPRLSVELNLGEVAYLKEIHAARRITLLNATLSSTERD
jgi:hypothetical protein